MKHLLILFSRSMLTLLLAGLVLAVSPAVQAEELSEPDYRTANMDIVDGEEIIMPVSSQGAVVDGRQLNHDYVKILNINNGPIVIRDESYTQNGVGEAWSSQEDAYVIKGKGTSANNVEITPTNNEITVYLVDLQWAGTINITGGSNCSVHLIVCGDCGNTNASAAIYNQRAAGALYVKGLTPDRVNTFASSNIFLSDLSNASTVANGKKAGIDNLKITTKYFIYKATSVIDKYSNKPVYYNNKLLTLNNTEVRNTADIVRLGYETIRITDSIINNLGLLCGNIVSDNSEILNISGFSSGGSASMKDSFFNYSTNVTNVTFDLIHSTLSLNSAASSSLKKINMTDSSLYSAVNYTGTPVNASANDLYLKKIRLRDFPNTYVWITIDNNAPSRLKTDSNGFLYPYVELGTTSISAVTEDGLEYGATFPATEGTDTKTTNLLPTQKSTPSILEASGNQSLLVGEKLNLSVAAEPGTSGRSLSYQWYKDGVVISGATAPNYLILEAVSRDSGVYKCTVREDGGGTIVSNNIYVTVSKPAAQNQPVIVSQTASMELKAGSSVTLVVAARPAVATDALAYQWYKNGNAVPEALTDSLILANIQAEQAGSYYCMVTEENFNTTIESAPVSISVIE